MFFPTLILLTAQQVVPTLSKPATLVAVPAYSRSQALSPDGRELAFTVDDGTLGFAAIDGGAVRLRVEGFPKWMDSIAWSPDGASVAVECEGERVRIVRATDGTLESDFVGSPVSKMTLWWGRDVRFVDGGKNLVLCGGSAPIQLRRRDGTLIAELAVDKECVSSVCAVTPDGKQFAVGDTHGNVGVWTADEGKPIRAPFHVTPRANCLAFDPTGRRLAVGGGDCTVRVFEIGSDAAPVALSHCDEAIFGGLEIGCVAFSPDGKQLVATSFSFHEVRLWDLASHSLVWRFDYGGGNAGGVSAHFSPDGSTVFASRGGEVHAAVDGKLVRRLWPDSSLVPSSNFGMDQGRAWIQTRGKLKVFDVASGKQLADVDLIRSR